MTAPEGPLAGGKDHGPTAPLDAAVQPAAGGTSPAPPGAGATPSATETATAARPGYPSLGAQRRAVTRGVVRAFLSTAVVLVLYFVVPLDWLESVSPLVSVPLGLFAFTAIVLLQVRAIAGAPLPPVRAVEALATTVPLFVCFFAATYYVMGLSNPDGFSEALARLDALYFAMTIFTTVGFGDISGVSTGARSVVTLQMAADLLVLGIGAKVILRAVREGQRRAGQPT